MRNQNSPIQKRNVMEMIMNVEGSVVLSSIDDAFSKKSF